MAKSNHGYEIYKKYTFDEVYESLKNNTIPDKIIYHDKDFKDSLKRINIIKELIDRDGAYCQNCKLEPKYFASGKDKSNRWHLDLYGEKDNEIHMLTIDHVHPKSKGGKNEISNYQLLCKICNEEKGDIMDGDEELKTKMKSAYIHKKLTSLSQQIKGILLKLKGHKLICVKRQKGFSVGKEYSIIDIVAKVDLKFDSKYTIVLKDDYDKIVRTSFNNFVTKTDYINMNS